MLLDLITGSNQKRSFISKSHRIYYNQVKVWMKSSLEAKVNNLLSMKLKYFKCNIIKNDLIKLRNIIKIMKIYLNII